ncbi:SMI1/KNR4 family protein [Nonomuraea candida]|uniref:SMI1/KNR4 family protein n=1 Tax=Nonomuraea candida TaxID=359159 RepID=UPI0012F750F5|nr:SMI1/KNR4 family protein [Nonomuraea candida]
MLKLVRLALTAAIVTAIVVRLRRRARLLAHRPAPPPAPSAPVGHGRTGGRMGLVWAAIAAVVALTLVAALVPGDRRQATAEHQRYQETLREALIAAQRPTQQPSPSPFPSPSPVAAEPADPDCSPAPRPVTVRPLDPRVKRAVDRQWRRIERWLRANAPRTYRSLGAPGRARTIAIAESQMGVDFPDDLRASLLRHNGSRGAAAFAPGLGGALSLSTRGMRDSWRQMCAWDGTDRAAEPALEPWDGRMIPFAYFPGRNADVLSYAVVDTADGSVRWEEPGYVSHGARSYHALLRAVADALERGTPVEGRRPVAERGVLRWQAAG